MILDSDFMFDLFKEHIPEITQWVNEKLGLMSADEKSELINDPLDYLPKSLRRKLKNSKAFRKAYRQGLLEFSRGIWVSHFENDSQFSYFCARCFSNDMVVDRVMTKGDFPFPASELERLFRVKNLRDSRKKLQKKRISKKYQYIDILFDTYSK